MFRRVKYKDILIPESRQRKEMKPEHVVDLATSIARNGILHPIIVRENAAGQLLLVAGECRYKAIDTLWNMGEALRFGGEFFPEGELPVSFLGEMDPIDAYEAELEENVRRLDISWQERADATARLLALRQAQAARKGLPSPTVHQISEEIRGTSGGATEKTRKELLVSKHLHDPEVAKAKTVDEAFKVLKRKEELKRSAELAQEVGKTFTSDVHQLLQGDCLEKMKLIADGSFDVILTDPPYGIDAQDFNNSGKLVSGTHFYDDSYETWKISMSYATKQMWRIAKPQAHAYLFCDVDRFHDLKIYMEQWGWKVFRTPLIWINPTAMRAPWPEHGPQRKWQMILYAIKGDRRALKLAPDVLTFPSDENLNHHAQKPVALYQELLSRSCYPGDSCIDPFCGSGPIFPAAHTLKLRATGIELDESAAGIAAKRIQELK